MEKSRIDALLSDYSASATVLSDPELRAVESAMFVEECFKLGLSDDEISPINLSKPEDLRNFVYKRMGV